MKTYTAQAERDEGGWWAITVPELDGVFTQARRLDQVEGLVRDAIALWLEVPANSFEVTVKASVPELDDDLAAVDQIRREADRLREEAGARTRRAARELADRGLTMRDIGQVLGISHQRAAQLLEGNKANARVRRAATKNGTIARRRTRQDGEKSARR